MQEAEMIVDYTVRIGLELNVKGLMNIQYVVVPGEADSFESGSVYVLEVNPRSSRTVPFLSKVTGVPMVQVATNIMLGESLKDQGYDSGLWKSQRLVAIKAPVFSMSKLAGVDTYLGPEMKSTGEVMGIDRSFKAALAKALMAAGLMLPDKGGVLLSIADRDKSEALPMIKRLSALGYRLYATEGTAAMIKAVGLPVTMISKILSGVHPNVVDVINDGTVDALVNTLTEGAVPMRDGIAIRRTAAERRIPCFTSLDTARVAVEALSGGGQMYSVLSVSEYLGNS
jgi:carbamoyl-phosphate synthase large subunit